VRGKQLKTSRWILFGLGILITIASLIFLLMVETIIRAENDKQLQQMGKRRADLPPAVRQQFNDELASEIRELQLRAGALMAVGVIFIGFGIFVYRLPVPITISALIVYLALLAIGTAYDPASLAKGWLVKILIVVGLAKAIQAAIAYENERRKAVRGRQNPDDLEDESL